MFSVILALALVQPPRVLDLQPSPLIDADATPQEIHRTILLTRRIREHNEREMIRMLDHSPRR